MAGFTTNKKTNHEIADGTGYVRAGQGGKRHRYDLKPKAAPKAPKPPEGSLAGYDDMSNPVEDFGASDSKLESPISLGASGPLDQDTNVNALPASPGAPHPHPPVAIHIHLSPSDHKAFKKFGGKRV
jgi:hypothetical protein